MDKYEYKLRSEEIEKLMENGKYAEAARLADSIDWRRVKSVITLQKIGELYRMSRQFEESRDIFLLAYSRNPGNRSIVSNLCEVSLELDDILNAIEYFKEFTKLYPRDSQAYVLRYKIYEAQNVGIEERIELLEELKKKDRIEEWEYQLAYLYHRAGMKTKCVEECDEFILWFGEGPFVMKAMELKMLHEPLSPQQQQKYDRFCEERVQSGVAFTNPNEEGVDFRVKTINIGAYNTMDLQAELAENLKDYIEDEPGDNTVSQPQNSFENTIPADQKEVFFEDKTEDIRFQVNQPKPAEGVNPKLEEWKKEFASDMASKGVLPAAAVAESAAVPTPVATVPLPVVSTRDVKEVYYQEEPEVTDSEQVQTSMEHFQEVMPENPELNNMLSQGGDGQISFVVQDESKPVEKQITGQLNINDILADWERMKKENEQKRQEEVRKHVLEQTGQILLDFDKSSNSGILAGLSEAEEVAQLSAEAVLEAESLAQKENKFYGSVTAEIPGSIWQEVAEAEAKEKEGDSFDVESLEENASEDSDRSEDITDNENEETVNLEQDTPEEDVPDEENQEEDSTTDNNDTEAEEAETETTSDRIGEELSPEEEELFEPFLYSSKMKKQIIMAIERISLASYAGNVLISGEAGSGAMHLAKCLVKHIQMQDGNFSGNVAKISGETLNRKDVVTIISKLSNGALIIEKAGKMSKETLNNLQKTINQEGNGILILLIDRRKEIEKIMELCPSLVAFFDVKVTILPMNNDVLVEYGRRYAYDLEYSIDEMGILALYKRISDMQTGKHAVTVIDVKKLIDEAILKSKRKSITNFASVLSGKRYDEEDMVILKEKDFIK